MKIEELKPHAGWSNDCQGKQDYDGRLISLSTRYWPGPEGGGLMTIQRENGSVKVGTAPYGSQPSAHAMIILHLGPAKKNDGGGDFLIWSQADFTAITEVEVKAQVERWAADQMRAVVDKLGGLNAFSEI